ncbi:long-chain-fatty-acid--CoA ligase [Hypericibacter terrae]|uniref:Long-chain-fatty-acid--CoA ligase n=1 Tax=Hypericibacter terrae TaxID=2602015 RepID=A0A5J6MRL8_9PROT|nr:AMP-binding protein [Hypericibacter terrae]QEX19973.1 long-chain-fatty-acid--CoA ligase [Hypericibacter terrae]
MTNAAFYLEATALRSPDATAVIFRDRPYSYSQIHRWATKAAAGLTAQGYGPGDRIALCCNNRPSFLIAYFGILMTGATVVNLLWTSTEQDFAFMLEDSEVDAFLCFDNYGDDPVAPRAIAAMRRVSCVKQLWILPVDPEGASTVIGFPSLADLMKDQPERFPIHHFEREDAALVVYTSGSTGKQKGLEISAGAVAEVVNLTVPLFEIDHCRVRLSIFTMECMMSQLFLILQPVFLGQSVIYLECENPETLIDKKNPGAVWQNIIDHGATFIVAVPSFYRWLLDHADGVRKEQVPLKLCISGGAALPAAWEREFRERLGVQLRAGYGASETCAALAWSWPSGGQHEGYTGKILPGIEARIVDDNDNDLALTDRGHLLVRSPAMMTRYINRPDLTATTMKDGWYHTRDIATFSSDGYLKIIGRMDSRITRGNEHIVPEVVESLLQRHPAVSLAAVVAVPHPTYGQDGKAFVTLKQKKAIDAQALLDWLRGELPVGQAPGQIEIRDALPMTNTGKIARHMLS